MDTRKRTVAILIFDDVELLDFAGPFEVFSSAHDIHGDHSRIMDVFAVAETMAPIRCRNGLVVQPEQDLASCPPFDILVVPGGRGTDTVIQKPLVIDWIRERTATIELLTSVCTGSFVLAKVGLPSGTPVTTYWESIPLLRAEYPDLDVREDSRWVDAGPIITGAGVSAGIDMALHIISRLYGNDVARATAIGIEYDYWE